jgi:L-serine dehydratase
MGPMRAAFRFARRLAEGGILNGVARVQVELYGSLALTGMGHATDRAVLLGLAGHEPATIDPANIEKTIEQIRDTQILRIAGQRDVAFLETKDLLFHRNAMTPPGAQMQHPNGLRCTAYDSDGHVLEQRTFFSIGGGFIKEDSGETEDAAARPGEPALPFPFHSAAELLQAADTNGLAISELMLRNECARRPQLPAREAAAQVEADVLTIWKAMRDCMELGMATEGTLPGGLNVRRRAMRLAERLRGKEIEGQPGDPLAPLDWVTVYAMAVNEENAAGRRVVTAPTNGAAGVVPAVARYYERFIPGADREGMLRFFLASAAIGILYKENASISGAEVGCQGEVGVACSMAAGGLTAALGGSNAHIEHAAEIAMEHNLGMTCDPIGGLVQIPCIERNAMGAAKAVHASRIALNESEGHKVSLDQVIRTMYLTGLDMQSRYKETSLAGLALNVIEC